MRAVCFSLDELARIPSKLEKTILVWRCNAVKFAGATVGSSFACEHIESSRKPRGGNGLRCGTSAEANFDLQKSGGEPPHSQMTSARGDWAEKSAIPLRNRTSYAMHLRGETERCQRGRL